jgi:hypothetical protein
MPNMVNKKLFKPIINGVQNVKKMPGGRTSGKFK